MKILFFLSAFPFPIDDGIKKIINNIIKEAIKQDCKVTLVVPKSNECLEYQKDITTIFYEKKRTLFSMIKDLLSLQPLYFSLYYDKEVLKKIDKKDYNLIFYDFYPMTQYSSALKTELFMMPDSMKSLAKGTVKNSSSLAEKIYHSLNYLLASIYNKKIASLKKLYVSNEDIQIDNIPNSYFLKIPADEIDFSSYWDIKQDIDEISFRGVMNFEPNISAVTTFYDDIFIDLIKRYPKLSFKIIGKNPVARLNDLNQKTSLTGFVNDPLLEMAKSYIHIVPMVSGSGVKTKLLDSMALKRLVFCTAKAINGIFKDIEEAERNGVVVYNSKDEFFNKFEKLRSQEIDYKNSVEKAYKFIKSNSYNKVLNRLINLKSI